MAPKNHQDSDNPANKRKTTAKPRTNMNHEEFITRWQRSGGAEMANSQSFLKELCQVLEADVFKVHGTRVHCPRKLAPVYTRIFSTRIFSLLNETSISTRHPEATERHVFRKRL